jgi:hypothetical protein
VKLKRLALVADRGAVLFIGVFLGVLIGYAFVPYEVGQNAAVAQAAPISMPSPVSADTDHPSPSMRKAAAEVRPLEIGVFGDSFGQGLGQGLALQFQGAEFKVHQFAKQGTGFTRYAQLNLLEDIRAKLDAHPVDIAVISFGANDTWDIYSGAQVDKYMSPGWQKIIGERVDAVTDLFRERGVSVYWVGLPRMRKPKFEAQAMQMNAFYASRMAAANVPFIDTVKLSSDSHGNYTSEILNPATGKLEHARAGDGIHMATGHAYGILTYDLSAKIHRQMELARSEAAKEVVQ